jgi:hypothetical protein
MSSCTSSPAPACLRGVKLVIANAFGGIKAAVAKTTEAGKRRRRPSRSTCRPI